MLHILLYTALAVSYVLGSISVANPLDNQLPTVARINVPYNWTFAEDTFQSSYNGSLSYTTSTLPSWSHFDSTSRTFSGTPSTSDIGTPEVMVSASDGDSSVSAKFSLCITNFPPLTLNDPLSNQFISKSPSLSSVFTLAPNSALTSSVPTLRVPPRWSFSIGLNDDTFKAPNDLFYGALLSDGSQLPGWMSFDDQELTFNGLSPVDEQTVSLAFHGSDQEGYTALVQNFNLVVAVHELSMSMSALPTINMTANTPFNISLTSSDDFFGVLIDDNAIEPNEITSLSIDVSKYSWLQYDQGNSMLSGSPPQSLDGSPSLPVQLTALSNQTLSTNVSLALVPSYFSASSLPDLNTNFGQQVYFDLKQYFSSHSSDEAILSASFSPANSYLTFNNDTMLLQGTVPDSPSAVGVDTSAKDPHLLVTFTAYSTVTHSTSHASLQIAVPSTSHGNGKHGSNSGLNSSVRAKLVLGLSIGFGIIGTFALFAVFMSAVRKCIRVRDRAELGIEGQRAWTPGEKRWYGVDAEGEDEKQNDLATQTESRDEPESPERVRVPSMGMSNTPGRSRYAGLGIGSLLRPSGRTPSDSQDDSSGMMSKADFLTRVKTTARTISDKYKHVKASSSQGNREILPSSQVRGAVADRLPFEAMQKPVTVDPFDDAFGTSLPGSPSSSVGSRSIPHRRADFVMPRSPVGPRPAPASHRQAGSVGSVASFASNASIRTHSDEAVVKTARVASIKSAKGVTRGSGHNAEPVPRLVPFKNAAKVPNPSPPSPARLNTPSSSGSGVSGSSARRVPSQRAYVEGTEMPEQGSSDDLSVGMHYVETLGGDSQVMSTDGRQVDRSSFSLGSSFADNGTHRVIIRAGSRFTHKVPVGVTGASMKFQARLLSGEALPKFMHSEVRVGRKGKGSEVVITGVPAERDIGEYYVGIYPHGSGQCAAKALVEIVGSVGMV